MSDTEDRDGCALYTYEEVNELMASKWVNVSKRLPARSADGIMPHYWVWGEFRKRDARVPVLAYFFPFSNRKGGNFGPVYECDFPRKVTHWMPYVIPAPPKGR